MWRSWISSLRIVSFRMRALIGHQINFGSPRNYTIVGVVGTVNGSDLARPVPEERIYLNATQLPLSAMDVVIQASLEPATLVPPLRAIVREIDPEQPIATARTLDEWIDRSLSPRRTPMTLLGLFGVLALVLSAIGVYGVLAFSVAQRVREFGLRQALGATRRSILSLVIAQGMTTTGIGLAVGFALSLVGTRYMRSMLFDVAPHDASVLIGVSTLLAVVAATACYIPARRATQVDPMVALERKLTPSTFYLLPFTFFTVYFTLTGTSAPKSIVRSLSRAAHFISVARLFATKPSNTGRPLTVT